MIECVDADSLAQTLPFKNMTDKQKNIKVICTRWQTKSQPHQTLHTPYHFWILKMCSHLMYC